jgi:hypothetical protein
MHYVRDVGAGGSNPLFPTNFSQYFKTIIDRWESFPLSAFFNLSPRIAVYCHFLIGHFEFSLNRWMDLGKFLGATIKPKKAVAPPGRSRLTLNQGA